MKIKSADLNICIDNKYEYLENICREYIYDFSKCDFKISVTDEEINAEGSGDNDIGYLESLAVCRKIAELLPNYNGILIQGVLIEVQNRGILFCAKTGVGKSTHAALWKKLLGEKCRIINDDKPIVRFERDVPYAYGTPWCGKENIQENKKVKLTDICFIERCEKNSASKIDKSDVLIPLMQQIYLSRQHLIKDFDLIDLLTKSVSFYKIKCNMKMSAARTAYKKLWEHKSGFKDCHLFYGKIRLKQLGNKLRQIFYQRINKI